MLEIASKIIYFSEKLIKKNFQIEIKFAHMTNNPCQKQY